VALPDRRVQARIALDQGCNGFDVVAMVGDGDRLVSAVAGHKPDACIIDVRSLPSCSRGTAEGRWTSSPRELEVLAQMAQGRSNQAIGEALVITPGAVEKHISSIFAKLAHRRPTRTTDASSRCWLTCAE
jgi:DNA-binding NarL/FixJ family response regulator